MRLPSLLLCASLLGAANLQFVPAASADDEKLPDPRFSYHPAVLVGTPSGGPVPYVSSTSPAADAEFTVVCRTIDNAPSLNRIVTIHFAGTGVRLYADQGTDCTLNLTNQTLSTSTGLDGCARFHPRFGGSCNQALATIDCEGLELGSVSLCSTDMDAMGGSTGLGDFALFAPLFVSAARGHPEADFDGSGGAVGLGDFVIFAREYLSGAHGSYCP